MALIAGGVYAGMRLTSKEPDASQSDGQRRPAADPTSADDEGTASADPSDVPCANPPTLTPINAKASGEDLQITAQASSGCDAGVWLSDPETKIVTQAGAVGELASGYFDLSNSRIWAAPDSSSATEVTLIHPSDAAFTTADELNTLISQQQVTLTVSGGASAGGSDESGSSAVTVRASRSGVGRGEASARAAAALERIKNNDSSRAAAAAGQVVAQFASKKDQTEDGGRVYGNVDILAEHRQVRQRHPGTLLLWSGDWDFDVDDLWVTAGSSPFSSTQAAQDWCRQQGYDQNHCLPTEF